MAPAGGSAAGARSSIARRRGPNVPVWGNSERNGRPSRAPTNANRINLGRGSTAASTARNARSCQGRT